jgi:hypothetical protein
MNDSFFSRWRRELASDEKSSIHLTHVLFLLSVVFLTYAPVMVATYAFMDDYDCLQPAHASFPMIWRFSASGGRPLVAFSHFLSFSLSSQISSLSFVRAVNVVTLCTLAAMIYFALSRVGLSSKLSALLAFILVTMPPFQALAAWAGCAGYPFAAAAAGVSAFLVMQSAGDTKAWVRLGRLALAGSLLLLGMMFHQNEVMFFWVFAAILALSPRERESAVVRKVSYCLLVGAVACIVEFLVMKLGVAAYGPLMGADRAGVTHDVFGKIAWFIKEPLKNALNLNSIQPKRWRAEATAIFIVIGLFFYFGGSLWRRLAMLGMALMLIPLSYLPNLVVIESWASYRTLVALTALLAFYVFLALQGYLQVLRIFSIQSRQRILLCMVACWAVFSGFAATRNLVRYFVEPQMIEYHLLKGQLRKIDLATVQTIYFIRPEWYEGATSLVRYDDFGLPSSCQPWVPEGMVKCAIREIGGDANRITVVNLAQDEAGKIPPSAAIIDMKSLKQFR